MFRPQYTLTPRLMRQIVQIERACGFLDAVEITPDWSARLRDECRVGDALSSVLIEGASLTRVRAAELAETGDEAVTDSEQEFLNYYAAFNAIDDLRGARDYVFGPHDLNNLHGLIVRGVRGHHLAARFRDGPVVIGDQQGEQVTVHHTPPEAERVRPLIQELMDWVEACKSKRPKSDTWVHPILVAGIAQHRMVWIHPYFDGNGRTARMFTTALLYQRRYDFKYLFDLSSYYNRDKDKYYAALRTADHTGDHTEWLTYFAGGLAWQLRIAMERARRVGAGLADPADAEE